MTWCDLVLTHGMFATMVVLIVAVLDVMILLPTLSAWSDMETLDFAFRLCFYYSSFVFYLKTTCT